MMKFTVQRNVFINNWITIKPDYLIHPEVSGNKFRKLKYNLEASKKLKHHTLLTFGGAFSYQIAAVAATGNECNYKTIGIIRGEELFVKIDANLLEICQGLWNGFQISVTRSLSQ